MITAAIAAIASVSPWVYVGAGAIAGGWLMSMFNPATAPVALGAGTCLLISIPVGFFGVVICALIKKFI